MASAVIGALRVNLGIDSAEFQDGLQKANSGLEKFAIGAKLAGAAIATAFATGISVAINRVEKADSSIRKIDKALANAGNAAKTSGSELSDWASQLERRTGRAAQEVLDIGANLASFNFGEEVFHRAIELADDMSAAWGGDLKSNLEGLSRALDDPANGFAMLRKRGIALTDSQQALVESLIKSNDKLGAQKVVLEALEGQVKGVAEAGFQDLTKSIANFGSAVEGFFDKIVQSTGFGTMLAGAIDLVTASIDLLTAHLGTVAEYAAVAGGSLTLMAAPIILTAVGNLTVAIGVGLVAAIRAVTTAMAANPLGALAIGIAVAITAIYHFRDEIQKAIGIDVVGIVKNAANYIIGSFVFAFDNIKFVWNNFPAIIGTLVVAAANVTIKAVEGMVNSAIELLNGLAAKANELLPSGLQMGAIGKVEIGELQGPDLSQELGERNAAYQAAMTTDWIGSLGAAFETSTPAVVDFSNAMQNASDSITGVGDAITGGGSGGAGKTTEGMLAGLEQLRQSLMTAEEAERNSYALRLIEIQEYYDAGLIKKTEYDDLMERAHQEHTDRMAEITRRGVEQEMRMRESLVSHLGSVMGSLGSILEKSGEKNLAASKAFAVGEAIINTAVGITQALRLPPPLSWAQAAAVAASGAAQIATIMSANRGSARRPAVGSSGGGSGSAGEPTRNDTPSAGTVNLQIQGFNRNELYSGEQVRELMDKMVELQRDGYQLVVVDT